MAEITIHILALLGIVCLSIVIAQVITPVVKWAWYYKIFMQSAGTVRRIPSWKPFNCEACMSWWMGIAYHLLNYFPTWYLCVFTGAICYVGAILLTNAIRRSV